MPKYDPDREVSTKYEVRDGRLVKREDAEDADFEEELNFDD
ncbi:hypothetical protein M193_gp003 [Halorubrum tailed phage 7]|uniref:Uncharacterized protein n=1 Tax=Halorubrum sodomense tailed virus 2 TaxID=1262527 RepID=L7TN37_9CAUD|nr:hypothetical protein HSTV2_3 [Halorubrum sodomense tailed virus 2]YP_008059987.1 hypothetical protein M193_gp003 [Halorubrum tailed phage 7]UBF22151.1 hypothetical protein HRTV-2_gp3 [Halorubrum virus HRTV-2]UBF22260.1 hypothetical protein HRTV-11_gp3 [Halorubrum virus HRTV-11]AGC34272.1 hypothetical protein HSTV2_3 [Halorubrum sodomense tailed virus 2]AGM10875.1 hypothetical protein HRTV7_3 [Halorubrum tailed phage 7]